MHWEPDWRRSPQHGNSRQCSENTSQGYFSGRRRQTIHFWQFETDFRRCWLAMSVLLSTGIHSTILSTRWHCVLLCQQNSDTRFCSVVIEAEALYFYILDKAGFFLFILVNNLLFQFPVYNNCAYDVKWRVSLTAF